MGKSPFVVVVCVLTAVLLIGCTEEPTLSVDSVVDTENVYVPESASSSGPMDTALAEISILSSQENLTRIKVEKIRDYNRYPLAEYPELDVADELIVRVYDTSALGASKTNDGVGVEEGNIPSVTPQPKLVEGAKYLASMSVCYTEYGFGCSYEGWSVALYPIQQLPPSVIPEKNKNTEPPSVIPEP